MTTDYLILRIETKIKLENPSCTLKPFLNQHTKLERRDMFLKALDNHWLIPAMQESNQYSKETVRRQGLAQILNLQQQINYLCQLLELDPLCFQNNQQHNLSPDNHTLNGNQQSSTELKSGKADTNQTLDITSMPSLDHLTDNMD